MLTKKTDPNFKNPYAGLDSPYRFNADMSLEDYHFLRLMRPTQGTLTTTFGLLFSKLIYELKQRGITDLSKQADFEHFVANFRFELGESEQRSTVGGVDQQTNASDDKGREAGGSESHQDAKNEQSVLPSSTQGGKAGSGSKRGSRTKSV